ncbi:uncharacterized protein EV422DRAFT_551231 [Fimicolochytrium jonesii]|uniref:uncharacterized protein n=1 Tax=Fimicolochytrium jonesii TaxID=1396493 RepID=UPI0022FE7139|nr:uncharacterized protein EV422DRAFT_551231 [Fimicolochytrium jonesii]KAI8818630.1 hypothetical protein EV422DRAFT_551231 [Fimicolochytrium jonesii]
MTNEKKRKLEEVEQGKARAAKRHISQSQLATIYHCNGCSQDITNLIRVRCAECADFDLCVACFCSGAEPPNTLHRNSHSYRVMEMLDFEIYDDGWGADEELKLVTAIESWGLGNWEQIAEQMGTKNRLQCEEHYNRVYINSDSFPIPVGPPRKVPKHERPPVSQPTNHEIMGYMPGRKEFETECENDAEHLIKDLEFSDSDSPEDTELKMAMFDMYNSALDRRAERKKFILDRNIVDFRKVQQMEKKRSKEERELFQKLRVFAKMQTGQDFENFMGGLLNEMKLRQEIAQLQEYRRMGLRTRREIDAYERDKKERELTKTALQFHPASGSRTTGRAQNLGPAATGVRNTPAPLDISNAEGVELLTHNEQQLCSNLRLFPKSYLVIKETILKEYAKQGSMRRRECRRLIKIDVNKTSRIYDYFVEMGG